MDETVATRAEIRAFDRYAIETLGVPGIVLMENAGRRIAEAALEMLRATGRRVVILAGRGNNGGDGFVVARHLAVAGIGSRVLLLGRRDEVRGDARTNLDILAAMGLEVVELGEGAADAVRPYLAEADLVVDGLLGTGLRPAEAGSERTPGRLRPGGAGTQGEIREPTAGVIRAVNEADAAVLAIDIPSGLDCDTGRPLGPTIRADRTVTMAAMKAGFARPGARQYTGEVTLADIGVPFRTVPAAGESPAGPGMKEGNQEGGGKVRSE